MLKPGISIETPSEPVVFEGADAAAFLRELPVELDKEDAREHRESVRRAQRLSTTESVEDLLR